MTNPKIVTPDLDTGSVPAKTPGYQLLPSSTAPAGQAIKCLTCGAVSHHPRDVAEKYCGNCHRFHEEQSSAIAAERAHLHAIGLAFEPRDERTQDAAAIRRRTGIIEWRQATHRLESLPGEHHDMRRMMVEERGALTSGHVLLEMTDDGRGYHVQVQKQWRSPTPADYASAGELNPITGLPGTSNDFSRYWHDEFEIYDVRATVLLTDWKQAQVGEWLLMENTDPKPGWDDVCRYNDDNELLQFKRYWLGGKQAVWQRVA